MRPIDGDAMRQDLRRQFEAIYKSAIETPIMPDDPFVKLLAKCEGLHMKAYIDNLCEYIDSRPTIDVPPVRRGEWALEESPYAEHEEAMDGESHPRYVCSLCHCEAGFGCDPDGFATDQQRSNFCPNCGADMRKEEHHEPEDGRDREELERLLG